MIAASTTKIAVMPEKYVDSLWHHALVLVTESEATMPNEKDTKTLLADAIRKRDELNTFIKVLQEMSGATAAPDAQSADPEALDRQVADVGDPASVVYPGMF